MPFRARLATALAAIYLVWGSTYLAISIAVRTLPPLAMAAVRFSVAGLVLYGVLRLRGAPTPARRAIAGASAAGALLLGGGNGLVCIALVDLPSSVIALVIATTPLFMALLPWIYARERPPTRTLAGIGLGLSGVAVLIVGTGASLHVASFGPFGLVVLATLLWSIGSLLSRRVPLPDTPAMTTAVQMVAGGLVLLVGAALHGELSRVDTSAASTESLLALLYLVFFGSMIGFGAYTWLLGNTSPALATSYAYVNPLVALVLGRTLAHEPLGPSTLVASGLIVTAVVLTVTSKRTA